MPDFSGRKHAIGLGREATRGTAVAPVRWVPWLDTDFGRKGDFIYNESVLGVLNKVNDSALVKEYGEGKLNAKVGARTIGDFLLMALGAVNTADNADDDASVKDHTFTEDNSNQTTSYTIAIKNPNEAKRFPMATIKKLEIEAKVGAWVEVNVEFLSKKPTDVANTFSALVEDEFLAKHARVEMADDEAGLASPTIVPLRSFKLSIERKLMDDQVLNSNDIADIFTEELEMKFEASLRYTNTDLEVQAFSDTQKALRFVMENTDVTLGDSAHPKLEFILPGTKITEWDRDLKASDMTDQKIGGDIYPITGSSIEAILTNDVASYAAA